MTRVSVSCRTLKHSMCSSGWTYIGYLPPETRLHCRFLRCWRVRHWRRFHSQYHRPHRHPSHTGNRYVERLIAYTPVILLTLQSTRRGHDYSVSHLYAHFSVHRACGTWRGSDFVRYSLRVSSVPPLIWISALPPPEQWGCVWALCLEVSS